MKRTIRQLFSARFPRWPFVACLLAALTGGAVLTVQNLRAQHSGIQTTNRDRLQGSLAPNTNAASLPGMLAQGNLNREAASAAPQLPGTRVDNRFSNAPADNFATRAYGPNQPNPQPNWNPAQTANLPQSVDGFGYARAMGQGNPRYPTSQSNGQLPVPSNPPSAPGAFSGLAGIYVPVSEQNQRVAELVQIARTAGDPQQANPAIEELTALVQTQFNERHRSQVARLKAIKDEVSKSEEVLDLRASQKDQIVERRVTELLGRRDPLNWDYEPGSSGPRSRFPTFEPPSWYEVNPSRTIGPPVGVAIPATSLQAPNAPANLQPLPAASDRFGAPNGPETPGMTLRNASRSDNALNASRSDNALNASAPYVPESASGTQRSQNGLLSLELLAARNAVESHKGLPPGAISEAEIRQARERERMLTAQWELSKQTVEKEMQRTEVELESVSSQIKLLERKAAVEVQTETEARFETQRELIVLKSKQGALKLTLEEFASTLKWMQTVEEELEASNRESRPPTEEENAANGRRTQPETKKLPTNQNTESRQESNLDVGDSSYR